MQLGDRFWGKVDKSGPTPAHAPHLGSCWLWRACLSQKGYGHFQVAHAPRRAHILAYEDARGPVPAGLELDHLCRVRRCVNPAHLEAVTRAVNARRGLTGANHKIKTHCPNGHPYDAMNTYHRSNGTRGCKECKRASVRAAYQKRKAA